MIQELISNTERTINKVKAEQYLGQRTGTYAFRCRRYDAVAAQILQLGLSENDLIVDVGAGMCEFDRYLRSHVNFSYRYLPVDGSIDGTELDAWGPSCAAEFFVCIETLEHLKCPRVMMKEFERFARKGVVITTPNPATVDVLALDPTHISPLNVFDFTDCGWSAEPMSLFGKPEDTIVAWKDCR